MWALGHYLLSLRREKIHSKPHMNRKLKSPITPSISKQETVKVSHQPYTEDKHWPHSDPEQLKNPSGKKKKKNPSDQMGFSLQE